MKLSSSCTLPGQGYCEEGAGVWLDAARARRVEGDKAVGERADVLGALTERGDDATEDQRDPERGDERSEHEVAGEGERALGVTHRSRRFRTAGSRRRP